MAALNVSYVPAFMDNVIHAVRQSESTPNAVGEANNLEQVLRIVGSLLTADQCSRLSDMKQIKTILDQDNEPLRGPAAFAGDVAANIRADWMRYWPRA